MATIGIERKFNMTGNEERTRILKMIEDGKITAAEAAQLIEAIDTATQSPQASTATVNDNGSVKKVGRWFHVRVKDLESGKVRVNVRLPLSLISTGIKIGAKFSPEVEKLDTDQLMEFINAGEIGPIADIEDEEDGEHVEVFIE
jgi:hypothetical protein